MTDLRPRRSVLYMPGSNARALEKAKTLDADALIFDLEDAVAPNMKEEARTMVMDAVATRAYGQREIIVRANALDTEWGKADIEAAAKAEPDGVLIPKVKSAGEIEEAARILREAGAPEQTKIWAMMETAEAVLDPLAIARAANNPDNRLVCFVMGTNDLAKDSRMTIVPGRFNMVGWLANCVVAAHACGVDILDGVYNDFKNEEGMATECREGAELGMDGKTIIHPKQIAPCNEAFKPSDDNVANARAIIEAFELPENQGKAAINLNGRMVELLHADIARRTVALAEAIEKRESATA